MIMQAEIVAIGAQAIDAAEPLVILFNEQATPAIKAVALIQRFTTANQSERLTMTTQSIVVIDGQHYQVTYVGALVNENLNNIGHVALIFDSAPEEDQLQSGRYLTPKDASLQGKPDFKVGTLIQYQETM